MNIAAGFSVLIRRVV